MPGETRRPQRSPVVVWRNRIRDSPDPLLRAPEVAVVNAVASYMNSGTLSCFPSVETIGRAARLSERSVRAALRILEDGGYLDVRRSAGRHTNVYAIPTRHQMQGSTRQENATNPAHRAPEVGTTKEADGALQAPAVCSDCGCAHPHHAEDCEAAA